MKSAFVLLLFMLVSTCHANEIGHVVRSFILDGYDSNDIVQMAAEILPPAKTDAEYRFDRMTVAIDDKRKEIRLRPIYKKGTNGFRQLNLETVIFTIGKLEAGAYLIRTSDGRIPDVKELSIEDQLSGRIRLYNSVDLGELRIARSTNRAPDDFIFPEIVDYELVNKDGSYAISLKWRGNSGLTADHVKVLVYRDCVVILPIVKQTDTSNAEKPILVKHLIRLPERVSRGRICFMVKGKTIEDRTWDLMKVLELK